MAPTRDRLTGSCGYVALASIHAMAVVVMILTIGEAFISISLSVAAGLELTAST